jgi:hypothetical protein
MIKIKKKKPRNVKCTRRSRTGGALMTNHWIWWQYGREVSKSAIAPFLVAITAEGSTASPPHLSLRGRGRRWTMVAPLPP